MYKSKMNKTVKNSKTTTPSKSTKSTPVAKSTKSNSTPVSNWTSTPVATPKKGRKTLAEKLEIVKVRIRRGDFSVIAKATGYDNSHVSKVIKGFSNNPSGEIVNYAYDFVGKRKVTA